MPPKTDEITLAIKEVKDNEIGSLQKAIEVANQGAKLFPRLLEVLRPIAEQRRVEYEETVEKVKAEFIRIGSGPDMLPQKNNQAAALRVFDLRTRTENENSVKANSVWVAAKNRINSLNKCVGSCKQSAANLQAEINKVLAAELRI